MKRLFPVLLVALLASCQCGQKQIIISNDSDLCRKAEMVEVCATQLGLTAENAGTFALYDAEGTAIPYQVMYYGAEAPKSIVFQASLAANEVVTYTWKEGTPAEVAPKVFARFVPERKDDFAWENDLAAYRMYGPALAPENPSNGVDLWLKCTDELIVDTFYYNEHVLNKVYHVNYGKGLDCYKVGHTLGCGGIAPYINDSLLVGNHYLTWEVIENGPLRAQFVLTYPEMTLKVTVDAGAQLNRGEVVYTPAVAEGELALAGGIFLHSVIDSIRVCEKNGWIAYAENAVSDAGLPEGRNYVAVVMPGAEQIVEQDNSMLAIAPYKAGETLTYYFGGGWSKWQFPTDEDWFARTAHSAKCIQTPLVVSVSK